MSILSNNDTIEDIKCWVNSNSSDIEYVYTQDGKLVFSKYTEIEDLPPLLYNSKKNNLALKNYRIYGNTINGESVGDRTANLFDGNFLRGYWAYANGKFIYVNAWICTTKIPCTGGQMYTYSFSKASRWSGFVWYDGDGDYISTSNRQDGSNTQYRLYFAEAPSNAEFMAINIAGYPDYNATILPSDITDFMLVEGKYTSETMPNYEPYGYRVPVTVTNGTDTQTTNLYLPEPIKMVGDEAEYIDYKEQKQHRVRKNLFDEKYENIPENLPIYEPIYVGDGYFTLSTTAPLNANSAANLFLMSGDVQIGASTATTGVWSGHKCTVESVNGYITVAYRYQYGVDPRNYNTMLNSGSEPLAYESYIENTELDVTLPALSTLSGTNTLSVGTNIQPSSVYLKGKI